MQVQGTERPHGVKLAGPAICAASVTQTRLDLRLAGFTLRLGLARKKQSRGETQFSCGVHRTVLDHDTHLPSQVWVVVHHWSAQTYSCVKHTHVASRSPQL